MRTTATVRNLTDAAQGPISVELNVFGCEIEHGSFPNLVWRRCHPRVFRFYMRLPYDTTSHDLSLRNPVPEQDVVVLTRRPSW